MNTNLISIVRAEVERLKEENNNIRCDSNKAYCQGYDDALVDLLSVLYDLEKEEKPSDGLEEEIDKFLNETGAPYCWCNDDEQKDWCAIIARHFYELCRQSKPKVYEELEEEYKDYVERDPVYSKLVNRNAGLSIARHFAQWGAEHATHTETPTNLEEEAEEWAENEASGKSDAEFEMAYKGYIAGAKWGAEHASGSSEIPKDLESYAQKVEDYYDVGEERGYLCTHRGDIKNAVLAGAKWQAEQDTREMIMSDGSYFQNCYELGKKDMKEQMTRSAVEGYISATNEVSAVLALSKGDFNKGDKVRIIIVKED